MKSIVFIDAEISQDGKVLDLGAVKINNDSIHTKSKGGFSDFVNGSDFICGHNIVKHDLKYIGDLIKTPNYIVIDTLAISPLVAPYKPYHSLMKDDKLNTDSLNNPLNDAKKAKDLFFDEVNKFDRLSTGLQKIYFSLLCRYEQFYGFFKYLNCEKSNDLLADIKKEFNGLICNSADINLLIEKSPIELAYALALISANERSYVIPAWVYKNFPRIENVLKLLRNTPCNDENCVYCAQNLDAVKRLNSIFGYPSFRQYNGEPLQQKAAEAAIKGKSLLAIFPTGGGKSITFQLPALIAGETARGLTVVISPLQSLMKDQVDGLAKKGIADAVTINGLLSPVEREEAIKRVESGLATILYISPESLRSNTIEKLLLSRNVVRFVIDEAHCFSAWGQDFRVDYLYIADFIKEYQRKKKINYKIPISCFTATAKQKVISDIKDYFKNNLDVDLELFATSASRTNLHYAVLYKETEDEKYIALRKLIKAKNCPTIVFVSRTRRTKELAEKLTNDGYLALPYNGKMERSEKVENQEKFIKNEAQVMVATSAFGMGVDKDDVQLVVHYDISDSLENYVQEAGRAGRNDKLQADCYVLFSDADLDKHFILLNQTKISIGEIQQIWKAIKELTKVKPYFCRSPLEIAREAGWDDSVSDIETRVKTAISALESAGYIKRGKKYPKVYATSILAKTMIEASEIIEKSSRFDESQKLNARKILSYLISSKNRSASEDEAESRIDWIADKLGFEKEKVVETINLLREEGLLSDHQDLTAYIKRVERKNKTANILNRFVQLERYILSQIDEEQLCYNLKEINDGALNDGIKSSTVKNIKTVLYYWTIRSLIKKQLDNSEKKTAIIPNISKEKILEKINKRIDIAEFVVDYLYQKCQSNADDNKEEILVQFSLLELKNAYESRISMFSDNKCTSIDIQDALLYLSKIGAMNLEGGFLVLYNSMEIQRIILDNKIKYKNEDYKQLNEHYQHKIQQIHIVGEYANMMVRDYDEALTFVNDYFQLEFKHFIAKYFKGTRAGEINRNITPKKYEMLFGDLSQIQNEIVTDDISKRIAVLAGPGSGKTKVLVHKLASLMILEDVKHEQMLMLTFSRAAATEFKGRLIKLMGNAAHFIEIKTFHSYCFDLLGKIGNIEDSEDIVQKAADMIESGEVEIGRITKSVLVIDEAQDMDCHEFALVEALMKRNEDMRVIAVGDDDQNIYEFRGSDSKYFKSLMTADGKQYEMLQNYRSQIKIVEFSNAFVKTINSRMKVSPIESVQTEEGIVGLRKYFCKNLEIPLVEQLIQQYNGEKTCVLTTTNEEALRITGLLSKKGMQAKLIQSNDDFSLYNLAEIRYFLKLIDRDSKTPIISNETWNTAKRILMNAYKNSVCYPIVSNIVETFESVNRNKYHTDFEEFLRESKYEDFLEEGNNHIIVSTMHKAKGREFDNVYILSNNGVFNDDKAKRAMYVAITRAKKKLYVHYSGDFFDKFKNLGIDYSVDNGNYSEPDEIMLQLSYKDVVLDFFKDKKSSILDMRSGASLTYKNGFLHGIIDGKEKAIAKCSKKCMEMIDSLSLKGYAISSANVRFIVAWKGENDTEESAIILPNIQFKK